MTRGLATVVLTFVLGAPALSFAGGNKATKGADSALDSLASFDAVSVHYTARFDLDSMGDQLCGVTGLCDCTATYLGSGKLLEKTGQRLTYLGQWTLKESDCASHLLTWVPSEGAAHHTLLWDATGQKVTEWVVHQQAADHKRFADNIKQRGQFWLSDMAAPLDRKRRVIEHRETENGRMDVISVVSLHHLTLTFAKP